MAVSLVRMVTLTDAEEADQLEDAKPVRFSTLVSLMSACSAIVFWLACWLYI